MEKKESFEVPFRHSFLNSQILNENSDLTQLDSVLQKFSSKSLQYFYHTKATENKEDVFVQVTLGWNEKFLCVRWQVKEPFTRAKFSHNQDSVWQDSCVEIFLSHKLLPNIYFNFEFNCIGTCLAAKGLKVFFNLRRKYFYNLLI